MKHVIDVLGTIFIAIVVIAVLVQIIRPYVPYLVLAAVLVFVGERIYKHYSNW